jgi:hypothetical protein
MTRAMVAVLAILISPISFSRAQAGPPDIGGVYQVIPGGTTLAGGLRNEGSPANIPLLPMAIQQMKNVNGKRDPAKMCQPIGPFRMMAREDTKIELAPALAHGMVVMLFEDASHGLIRTIFLNRAHPAKTTPSWMGDSIGRWEGNTLVVDTTGFNGETWLNDAGARHSDDLHLVERIRPVLSGKYLEYKVTAEDPKVLAKPYAYTRYYEKLKTEIKEDVCEDEP